LLMVQYLLSLKRNRVCLKRTALWIATDALMCQTILYQWCGGWYWSMEGVRSFRMPFPDGWPWRHMAGCGYRDWVWRRKQFLIDWRVM
jgi:hypothetical protein